VHAEFDIMNCCSTYSKAASSILEAHWLKHAWPHAHVFLSFGKEEGEGLDTPFLASVQGGSFDIRDLDWNVLLWSGRGLWGCNWMKFGHMGGQVLL